MLSAENFTQSTKQLATGTRPRDYKTFFMLNSDDQLSMKFSLPVSISIFISREIFMLNYV